jgi:hypothetical protein
VPRHKSSTMHPQVQNSSTVKLDPIEFS